MKQNPIVYKSLGGNIEVNSRRVSGYLAAFGMKDSDDDIIVKGAFSKSLRERGPSSTTARKIAFLYMHDITKPIGRFDVLKEDDHGLYFEAELDNIPLANDVLEQYKSGTLNQHSIGFRYIHDKISFDETEKAFLVKEVDLFEGSVVTLGANENTPFLGMKSEQFEGEIEQLRRDTELVLKHIPFEEQYRIRQLISKHIALAKSEPMKVTPEEVKPQLDIEKLINHIKTL